MLKNRGEGNECCCFPLGAYSGFLGLCSSTVFEEILWRTPVGGLIWKGGEF